MSMSLCELFTHLDNCTAVTDFVHNCVCFPGADISILTGRV